MPSQHIETTADTEEQASRKEQLVEFTAMVALALGLGALGFGTGLHVSLMSVQAAVVETTRIPLEPQVSDSLYAVLVQMQSTANLSLYASAALLVGGGALAERHRLRDQIKALTNTDTDDGGDPDA